MTAVPNPEGGITYQPLFVLAIFIFVWANDTGAYLVGSTMGKHRLFERISPQKVMGRFFGGMVVVLLVSQIFSWYMRRNQLVSLADSVCYHCYFRHLG